MFCGNHKYKQWWLNLCDFCVLNFIALVSLTALIECIMYIAVNLHTIITTISVFQFSIKGGNQYNTKWDKLVLAA